jgi:hypothetical protein
LSYKGGGKDMTKARKIAGYFIDLVETVIRDSHPKVDRIGQSCKGHTLLYGETYYTLEDIITEKIEAFKRKQDKS